MWSRIKFTHINLGYWNDYRSGLQPLNTNKTTDLCAIFQAEHKYNEDHGVRNDLQYTHHRKGLWDILQPLKICRTYPFYREDSLRFYKAPQGC